MQSHAFAGLPAAVWPQFSRRPNCARCARRPRVATASNTATPTAVFLPPDGAPVIPLDDENDFDAFRASSASRRRGDDDEVDEDDDGNVDGDRDSVSDDGNGDSAAGVAAGANTPHRRYAASGVDRVLEGTEPEYETWVTRNARRSLATVRGREEQTLGAEQLNDSLRPGFLDKHRYILAPDEAFGAIFAWDVVMSNARELELAVWRAVAAEEDLLPPDMDDILRAEAMSPEAAVQRIFLWTADWGDIKRLVFRKGELLDAMQADWTYTTFPGVANWLDSLNRYGIKSVLCAPIPRARVEQTVHQVGLQRYFGNSQLVTADDECDSVEQMFLTAAIKLERPPAKCVVFTDKPSGITAGREVSARVVALIGAHPAYEIKSADKTFAAYDDLVLYHVRSLFAQEGSERGDPETELEVQTGIY
jgi:beta-phosphoglucomutase-like phosphatase (HAD superfamily)